jgi:hypothetical protein
MQVNVDHHRICAILASALGRATLKIQRRCSLLHRQARMEMTETVVIAADQTGDETLSAWVFLRELTIHSESSRYEVGSEVRVNVGGIQMTSRLIDISAGGARLAMFPGAAFGMQLNIELPDGVRVDVQVVPIFKDQRGKEPVDGVIANPIRKAA